MSRPYYYFRPVGLLGVLIALTGADTASAGWMGFRNDTKETLVIQETFIINGQARLGRPQRLFGGESVRDTQCAGGQRQISIYDTKDGKQPLYTGSFPCPRANENILYCIKPDGRGGLLIEALKSPAGPPPSPRR